MDPHLDDYAIHITIRRFVLGSSLDMDLQISSSHHNSSTSQSVSAPDMKGSDSSGGGDGRASHMVAMTVENIPPHLYPPTQLSSSARTQLSYYWTTAVQKGLSRPSWAGSCVSLRNR